MMCGVTAKKEGVWDRASKRCVCGCVVVCRCVCGNGCCMRMYVLIAEVDFDEYWLVG